MIAVLDLPARHYSETFQSDRTPLASASPASRAESRIQMRMFVKLSNPESGKFDIAQTIDISDHGARVVCRTFWVPNQQVLVRSIRGNFNSHAQVVHCQALTDDSYVIGLKLHHSTGDWTTFGKTPGRVDSAKRDAPPPQVQAKQEKAIDVFREIYELLEDYAPTWYSQELHERMREALRVLGRPDTP